jgi:hypothetical protein
VFIALFRPIPTSPNPANDWIAKATNTYVQTRMIVVINAAIPGVLPGSFVSSPTARHASQPQ